MNKVKILSLFMMFLLGNFLVSIPYNSGVKAEVGEEFTLKDTFENDQYQNRIYTEYDNHTQEEYFRDYIGDSADFTEDTEGFTADTAIAGEGIENGYYQMWCGADWDSIDSPALNLTVYPLLEFRIWSDTTSGNTLMGVFRDYNNIAIYNKYWFGIVSESRKEIRPQ